MAEIMRFAATDVREGVIPDSGHWIMEENPAATIAMVRSFLKPTSKFADHGPHQAPVALAEEVKACLLA